LPTKSAGTCPTTSTGFAEPSGTCSGVNVIKLFSLSLTKRLNKLERLSLASLSGQVEYFRVSPGAYPKGASVSGLNRKYSTGLVERLARDKRSSLFGLIVIDKEKWFYNIVCWLWLAFEKPSKHPTISPREQYYIEQSIGGCFSQKQPTITTTPWRRVFTCMPVYAIIVANFARCRRLKLSLIH
jgi:hypothetical protein